jgi:hypothetical protein
MLTADSPWAHVKLDGWQVMIITHPAPDTTHLTRHTSHITHHTSNITHHTTSRSYFTLQIRMTCPKYHQAHQLCARILLSSEPLLHTSHLTPHTSHLTPHTSHTSRARTVLPSCSCSCILRDPAQRLTAAELLQHEWMVKRDV